MKTRAKARRRIPLVLAALWAVGLTGCGLFKVATPPELQYARYSAASHNDFGVAYEAEGDFGRALREYAWVVRKEPMNYVAWTNLGNIHHRYGEVDEARDAYRRALAWCPGYGPAVNNLAMSYLESDPPRPDLAKVVIEAHLPQVEDVYLAALEETLLRASELASRPATTQNPARL